MSVTIDVTNYQIFCRQPFEPSRFPRSRPPPVSPPLRHCWMRNYFSTGMRTSVLAASPSRRKLPRFSPDARRERRETHFLTRIRSGWAVRSHRCAQAATTEYALNNTFPRRSECCTLGHEMLEFAGYLAALVVTAAVFTFWLSNTLLVLVYLIPKAVLWSARGAFRWTFPLVSLIAPVLWLLALLAFIVGLRWWGGESLALQVANHPGVVHGQLVDLALLALSLVFKSTCSVSAARKTSNGAPFSIW